MGAQKGILMQISELHPHHGTNLPIIIQWKVSVLEIFPPVPAAAKMLSAMRKNGSLTS